MRGAGATSLLAAMMVSTSALGADVQFCVEIETTLTDASRVEGQQDPLRQLNVFPTPASPVTEDYWTTQVFERPPYGARYQVRRNGSVVKSGYLGDGFDASKPAGCTDMVLNTSLSANWYVYVYSDGVVQDNYLYSYDHSKQPRMMSLYFGNNPVAGPNTKQFSQSTDEVTADVMTGYITASFALFRHAGGETGNKYYLYRCQCSTIPKPDGTVDCIDLANYTSDCTCTRSADARSCTVGSNATNDSWNGWLVSSLTPKGINRKYTLVHELGHQIAYNITGGVANGCSVNLEGGGQYCVTPSPTNHTFWSYETQKCAFKEAFADFYSADVWNSHSQSDCASKYYARNNYTEPDDTKWLYYGAFFDCAGDDGGDSGSGPDDFTSGQAVGSIGVPFLDKCEGPQAGRATEMDYARVLWNVHTDGSTPPTFTDIARWIRDCSGISEYNVFTRLDECAEPRNDSLEANWDANKAPHNVDNPAP
jgi:hypothetical protein